MPSLKTAHTYAKDEEMLDVRSAYKFLKSFELSENEKFILDIMCHTPDDVGAPFFQLSRSGTEDLNKDVESLVHKGLLTKDADNYVYLDSVLADAYYAGEKVYEKPHINVVRNVLLKLDYDFVSDDDDYESADEDRITRLYKFILEHRKPTFIGEQGQETRALFSTRLGKWRLSDGKIDEALKYFRSAVRYYLSKPSPLHAELIYECWKDIACCYWDLEDYKPAEAVFRKLLKYMKTLGSYSFSDFISVYRMMGDMYERIEELDKMVVCRFQEIEVYEALVEDARSGKSETRHGLSGFLEELMWKYHNYANALCSVDRDVDSLEYRAKALAIANELYPTSPNHEDIAFLTHCTGRSYMFMDQYDTALDYMLKALPNTEKAYFYDRGNRDLILTYEDLGILYGAMERHEEAYEYAKKALECQIIACDSDLFDSTVAEKYASLSESCHALGKYDEELECLQRVYCIYDEIYKEPNDCLGKAHYWLGALLGQLGRKDEALEHLNQALHIINNYTDDEENKEENLALINAEIQKLLNE